MDENTWRFAQLMMWLIGIQTGILIAVLGGIWAHFNSRLTKIDEKFDKKFDKIDERFNKMDEKLNKLDEKIIDIDKRVFAIETMLHMKDCCMLKDDRLKQKAE